MKTFFLVCKGGDQRIHHVVLEGLRRPSLLAGLLRVWIGGFRRQEAGVVLGEELDGAAAQLSGHGAPVRHLVPSLPGQRARCLPLPHHAVYPGARPQRHVVRELHPRIHQRDSKHATVPEQELAGAAAQLFRHVGPVRHLVQKTDRHRLPGHTVRQGPGCLQRHTKTLRFRASILPTASRSTARSVETPGAPRTRRTRNGLGRAGILACGRPMVVSARSATRSRSTARSARFRPKSSVKRMALTRSANSTRVLHAISTNWVRIAGMAIHGAAHVLRRA